jgi:acetyltransferase-like isoleucine patch superfamily enzyme
MVDPFVHESADLGPEVELGRGVVIEKDVVVGPRCRLGHGVVLRQGTRLEAGCVLGEHTVVGAETVVPPTEGPVDRGPAVLGPGVLTGVGVVVHRGARLGKCVILADRVVVGRDVDLGSGTVVCAGTILSHSCSIGEEVRIEPMVFLAAYSRLGDRSTIAPFVATSNDNSLGRRRGAEVKEPEPVVVEKGGRLGLGAVVLGGKKIGEDAFVAAGALVTRDVPPRMMVRGVPAKIWKPVATPELLEKQRLGLDSVPPKRKL